MQFKSLCLFYFFLCKEVPTDHDSLHEKYSFWNISSNIFISITFGTPFTPTYIIELYYFGINIGMTNGLVLAKDMNLLNTVITKIVLQQETDQYYTTQNTLLMQLYSMVLTYQ